MIANKAATDIDAKPEADEEIRPESEAESHATIEYCIIDSSAEEEEGEAEEEEEAPACGAPAAERVSQDVLKEATASGPSGPSG